MICNDDFHFAARGINKMFVRRVIKILFLGLISIFQVAEVMSGEERGRDDPPPGCFFDCKCSIPDDHIDPRRSALFMARSVLREARDGDRTC